MAENRKGRGDSLYYLSRGQLLILAAGFTLTTVLVFLLGVLIGQGIEERKAVRKDEPLARLPLQPLTPGSKSAEGSGAKGELTFYDTLAKPPAQKQPAKEAKSAEKAAKAPTKEAKETKEAKVAKAEKAKEKAGAEKTATAAAKKPAPAKKPAEEEKKKEEAALSEGTWTVQVNAFPEEKSAQKLVERLREKGYDAYVVAANIKGQTWYRVRVGHFGAKEEAKDLLEDLQTKEKFTKAATVSR